MICLTERLNMNQQTLDNIFSALSDPTRREILSRIAQSDLTVSDIAKPYTISLPAISKHLKILERTGLISRHKNGREIRFSLNPDPLKEASRYLSFYRQFWNEQFDSLEKFLAKEVQRDGK